MERAGQFEAMEAAMPSPNLLQQMGDRSIVLLIGIGLLIYSAWENQNLRKPLGLLALGLGTLFLLICLLVVRDSFSLRSQAIDNIGNIVCIFIFFRYRKTWTVIGIISAQFIQCF